MIRIQQRSADGQMRVWSVKPADLPKVLQGLKNLPIETLLGDPEVVPPTMAEKVAWTHMHERVAAFFDVGDIILFGKYKNKKGRIVKFDVNAKGQPLVEIEPIPKGRKQNKVLGLFKIWSVKVIEKAQKDLAEKVASRFKPARGERQ